MIKTEFRKFQEFPLFLKFTLFFCLLAMPMQAATENLKINGHFLLEKSLN